MSESRTVLITVTGPDGPGISAGLFTTLANIEAQVLDVEQISVRRRLTLSVLVEVPAGDEALKDILLFGFQHDLQIDMQDVHEESVERHTPHVITVIGRSLSPQALATVTEALADGGANIDRISRLSKYPVMSYELVTNGGRADKLKANLVIAAAEHPTMDVAIQPLGLSRRAKRLVMMDVDSTLVQDEAIVLLAEQAGTAAEVHDITERAMAGELDFEESLRARVKTLAGLDELAVERAWRNLRLTAGARTFIRTLKRLGYTTAIVSGGFSVFTERLRKDLEIDYSFANTLEKENGLLTGGLDGPIVDRAAKATFLKDVAGYSNIPVEQTVAIGDGANDLDMLATAGLGIAFNAKEIVREAADTSIGVPYLDAVLFLLGVPREEIEAADNDDPNMP